MSEERDDLKVISQQLCDSYRAIDDARTKLLGLLTIATGAGILGLSGGNRAGPGSGLSVAVGVFGVVATLGLFSYEIHGIKKCAAFIDAGRLIEERLNIYGQFKRRPREAAGFIDEPFSASIIYPASLAGWVFFAMLDVEDRWIAYGTASAVLLVSVAMSIWLIRAMEADVRDRKRYNKEPWWLCVYKPVDLHDPLPDDARICTDASPSFVSETG